MRTCPHYILTEFYSFTSKLSTKPKSKLCSEKKVFERDVFSCPKGDFENSVRFNLPKKNILYGLILKKECSNFIKFKFYFDKKNLRQLTKGNVK